MHGRTDDDPESISADDVARGGLVDAEITREVPQQAHRGELGGAYGEAADREGEMDYPGADGPAGYRAILKSGSRGRSGRGLVDGGE